MAKKSRVKEPKSEIKGGRMTNKKRLQLLDTIRTKYEKQGIFNKLDLARELKINRATLYSLINELKIDMETLPIVKIEMKLVFGKIQNRLMYLWDKLESIEEKTGIPQIRSELSIMKEIKETIKDFYKLLQEFGEADKQADKIDLQADITQRSLNIQLVATAEQLKAIQNGNS